MSNPNPPPETPPALTAAELRRRLLAGAPPTAGAATPELPEAEVVPETSTGAGWAGNGQNDLLARLRMPGKSGSVPVPLPRPAAPVPLADPTPTRSPVTRRIPSAGGAIAGALNQLAGFDSLHGRFPVEDASHGEAQRLKAENKELRTLLDEMKHLLQEASETEQRLATQEKEFGENLAAKDAQIEELSSQLGAIEDQIAKGELAPPPPVPKTRTELEDWSDELEKESAKIQQERKRLERDRQQLREDEEALETQMREMEVAMARERALLARQEIELRRLNAEIQHELELMQRGDTTLREHMAKFQRRAQEVMTKPPGNRR